MIFLILFLFFVFKSGEKLNESDVTIRQLEKMLTELQGTIDLETVRDTTAKLLAKQESFKSKVKESGVTLERTKNVRIS